jgi:hypothetical protein
MVETMRSIWGSFWCWFFGHHRGNVQWGEYGRDGKTTIHKCSKCWIPARRKARGVASSASGNNRMPKCG